MSSMNRALTVIGSSVFLLQACSNVADVDETSLDAAIISAQSARSPTIERFQNDVTFIAVSCDEFDVIRHVVENAVVQTFFNRDGDPVRVAIHVVEKNTLTNSVTGEAVDFPGVLNLTFLLNGTTRVTGTPIHVTVPGEGNFVFDAGILITDQDGNTIFEGGPHPFGPTPDPTIFCSLLG